ncbi:GNAT family N-acetyltransferase [Herbiconiux moechotypicola]|uniref:N-acetyltransferase domain-containing protein n=1 Tax=Herbiconiux moechotypicola TaxID=637393 RepID=A0ABN3E3T3_9MICO|nr:GNAT family N-acetyltransferase [Herbiconiux moechotypicola]MCS5731637.1 GNAT family N-acetyltransferase [Herbiconiux moechotypicola]
MTQIRASLPADRWNAASADRSPANPLSERLRNTARSARDLAASAGLHRPRAMRGARTEKPFDAPVLRTSRLRLRPHRVSEADLAGWFALQSEASVREFLPWPERTRRQSERHLRDRLRHTRLWQADDFLALAVELDGALIGDVSLHLRRVAAEHRSLEIGWVLHPAHGGSGFATEAAQAMIDFAFETVGAQEVIAVTDARNRRSVALARRLGFTERSQAATGDRVFALSHERCRLQRDHLAA